jgi:[protein-PII] uridylyltransferase
MASQRHVRFQNTIYHLEPDVKESPGGIRDLHLLHWLGETPDGLETARDFLFGLRFGLHDSAGRDRNQLTFEAQDELDPADPAGLMRDYYRHARTVFRAARHAIEQHEGAGQSGLLSTFRDWRSRLSNPDFTVSRDRVFLRAHADAETILRLFVFIARHGIPLAADTEARVTASLPALERTPITWTWWTSLLSQPHAALGLRALHETGALDAILPEWKRIECLVARDFYHRYTVDEHTLVTIEAIEKLRHSTEPIHRRFFELYSEAEGIPLLRFALLLHDIGKGSGEDHSIVSVRLANEILARLRAPQGQRRQILFLIEHHLDLSTLMNSRDLTDPEVVEEAAHRVETVEQLKLLTLLTYADISAVNPTAMTPWRAEQLWRAYRVIRMELTRELRTDLIHAAPSDRPELRDWLDGFPTRYLRTHSLAEIEQHIRLDAESRLLGAGLSIEKKGGFWEATIVTSDKPGLFAALAGAISSCGMNILKVEAFANAKGRVLDTFTFADPHRTLELNTSEVDTFGKRILEAALGEADVARWLRGRPRPAHPVRLDPIVAVDAASTANATLVEVVAADRPGLLFDLASVFHAAGCSVDVVLIDTEAHKAIDVFYVTKDGAPLEAAVSTLLRDRLLEASRA